MDFGVFYDSPVWAVFLLIFLVNLLALEVGFRVGLKQQERWHDVDAEGGNLVLTSMLALLGLMLAFTFSAGIDRSDKRKAAAIDEANALGTAFLRTSLVEEPGRTALQNELLDYARTRIVVRERMDSREERQAFVQETLGAQAKIWPTAQTILRQREADVTTPLFLRAINDVLDQQTIRLEAALDRHPPQVLSMLILIAVASLAVAGFNAGIRGIMSRWRMTIFAAVLAGVMYIIVDLDRPYSGFIQMTQVSLELAISDMELALEKP